MEKERQVTWTKKVSFVAFVYFSQNCSSTNYSDNFNDLYRYYWSMLWHTEKTQIPHTDHITHSFISLLMCERCECEWRNMTTQKQRQWLRIQRWSEHFTDGNKNCELSAEAVNVPTANASLYHFSLCFIYVILFFLFFFFFNYSEFLFSYHHRSWHCIFVDCHLTSLHLSISTWLVNKVQLYM